MILVICALIQYYSKDSPKLKKVRLILLFFSFLFSVLSFLLPFPFLSRSSFLSGSLQQ